MSDNDPSKNQTKPNYKKENVPVVTPARSSRLLFLLFLPRAHPQLGLSLLQPLQQGILLLKFSNQLF